MGEQYLREELCRRNPYENRREQIYNTVMTAHSLKEAAKTIKGIYGWCGNSCVFSDGTRGFIQYTPNEVTIKYYAVAGEQESHFTWLAATGIIRELAIGGVYYPLKITAPSAPTLKEILDNHSAFSGAEQTDTDINTFDEAACEGGFFDAHEGDESTSIESEADTVMPAFEPAIPMVQNYRYNGSAKAGHIASGAKERFRGNLAALETLLTLEKEERPPTPTEQDALASYAGWGGLPEAFYADNASWAKEYEALKSLLSEDEYASARASALTSFYTPLPLIKAVYGALVAFGLSMEAQILDPAMGTGRFFGELPEELAGCRLHGVEIDSLSARISRQLYPNATILHRGFEKAEFMDGAFDAAVGNVPFGNYGLADPRYDRYGFLVHDFFFAKAVDKVRPGGIVAFITSHGTLDKVDSRFRAYLARRADLIGAVRLPNSAFAATGTKVTADIIFLQVRGEQRAADDLPEWVELPAQEDDLSPRYNRYFADHPEMMLGSMQMVSGPFGPQAECLPRDGDDIEELLHEAVRKLNAAIPEREAADMSASVIAAPPEVKNFTFVMLNGSVFYREHHLLLPQQLKPGEAKRVAGMCGIREVLGDLIEEQTLGGGDAQLEHLRGELNRRYDEFAEKYGSLNDRTNARLFRKDVECNLLLALETGGQNGIWGKSDIFTRRTVDPRRAMRHADNAFDALYMSLNARGRVDIAYMTALYGSSGDAITGELGDAVFIDPGQYDADNSHSGYVTSEDYLSGNVRMKLEAAKAAAANNAELFGRNVKALGAALPDWIEAGQIEARLGATWLDGDIFTSFAYETFGTPVWLCGDRLRDIHITYNQFTTRWTVYNGSSDAGIKAREVFGTRRLSAYALLEDCLNLKEAEVRDKIEERYVLNPVETQLARAKQAVIKNAFSEWIFSDPKRRHNLESKYNERFNAIRPRKYEGSYLELPGLSSAFEPRQHQRDAVARICDTGQHTLLDHVVGAGKTATMIIGAYELIRLGGCKRALFAVPNHIVGDFGREIYRLYPDAKAMIVSEQDFERNIRQRFLSRIIYSDVDMIVLGHSQFERIAMSPEYQEEALTREIDGLSEAIRQIRMEQGSRVTVKQMEAQKVSLEAQLTRLQATDKKDSLVTFEMMGVDCLMVDEADMFKNCYIFSKMRGVAGVGGAASQRAADMLMKCRYMTEKGGKIVFATGTPISNTLGEMYVMQRYLQEGALHRYGINHFDEWVANFAEATASLELTPEGNGFRQRTRLSKYYNIPELMQLYRQVADVQTSEMLNLPRPKIRGGKPQIVVCRPSQGQLDWVQEGVERCRAIRDRRVNPSEDNMLKFTSEARLASLDMRLVDPDAPFDPEGKAAVCAGKIMEIYRDTSEERGVQLVFCDSATPSTRFNIYGEIKRLCMESGIPGEEVAFIHDAKDNKSKMALFQRCREGEVRVLIGSTEKCGAGTNIQDRLAGLHHVDCPYRPRDIEQREGRILRQGNRYSEVEIYRYVTERSFDSYLWSIVTAKQRFISQIRQGGGGQRVFEDMDEALLSFETVQAVATGNPLIMEKIALDNELSRLRLLKSDHRNQQYRLEDAISKLGKEIENLETRIDRIREDMLTTPGRPDGKLHVTVGGRLYDNREEAGNALLSLARTADREHAADVGELLGLRILICYNSFSHLFYIRLQGAGSYTCELNEASGSGTVTRMENLIKNLPALLKSAEDELSAHRQSLSDAKAQLGREFAYEKQLEDGSKRQAELNILLGLDSQPALEAGVAQDDSEYTKEIEHDMEIE